MNKLKFGLGLTVIAALAACGGGGGGAALAPVELTGVAAKGLIKGGMVKAYTVTNGVVSSTAVESAETNDKGEYKLTKIPADALVKLEVVPIEGKTKVVDETDGTEYTPASDFKLSAVLAVVPGAANEAHITPATEMVVQRAQALGGITANNAAFAAGEIQSTLGFSPNEKPVFSADGTTPASKAAVYLKTVALVAKDATTATTLGCSDATNAARVACVTQAMASKAAKGGSDFTAVTTALAAKQDVAKTGVSASVASEVAAPVAIKAPADVKVPSNLPVTAIEKAKQFFQTLKASLKLLTNDDPAATTFQTELDKAATEFKNTTNPANDYALNAADFMLSAAGIYKNFKDGNASFEANPVIWKNNVSYRCSWFESIDNWKTSTPATTQDKAAILSCRYGEIVQATPYKTSTGNYPIRYWSGIRTFITGDAANTNAVNAYSYLGEVIEYNSCPNESSPCMKILTNPSTSKAYYLNSVPTSLAENYPDNIDLSKLNKAVITFTKLEKDAVSAELSGFIAPAVKYKETYADPAKTSFNTWVQEKKFPAEPLGIKHGINLKLDASTQNNQAIFKFSGFHSLYKTADVVHSKISLDTGSQITGTTDSNNNFTPTGFDLSLTVQGENVAFTGKLAASSFLKGPEANSKSEPTKIVLDGSLKLKTDELFKGTITFVNSNKGTFNPTLAISETNFDQGTIEIVGDFKVPSKDPLQLKIKLAATEYKKPTISLNYSQKESPLITLKAYGNELDPSKEYMEFAFGADVTATAKKGEDSFELKSNGATIANYKKSTGKIEYLDGSFEKF